MAVRWIGPGGRIWVWERPPSKLKCLYNDKSYKVQLPWVVFVVDVVDGGVWAFARPGPIGSLEDQLYHLPLPGISKEGKLPVVRIKVGYSAEVIIQQAMQRFQEQFWAGEVPLDWQPEEIRTGDTTKMLTTWSEGDAVDVVNWGWIPRLTLGELANRHDASGRASCESLREFLEQAIRQ